MNAIDRMLLFEVLRRIGMALRFTAGGEEKFFASDLIQEATIRQLEVIGEIARSVSTETKEIAPSIAWREMVGMRNQLIHGYQDIKLLTVWQTVEEDLVPLRAKVEELLDRRL